MRQLLSFIAIICFVGCITENIPTMTDINPILWRNTKSITFENKDSLSMRSMDIIVLHNSQFKGNTLHIKIKTTSPDSLQFEEVILVQKPQKDLSSIFSNEIVIPYRQDVILKHMGEYQMEFTPSVATKGVEAIGVAILPTKNK